MKKKAHMTALFLISLTPMLLNQFGGRRGVQELPGYISLLNPLGFLSVILCCCGIWCDFTNLKLKKALAVGGLSGIILSEIYTFLTWYIPTITGAFSIQNSFRFAFPSFYFGLFVSCAMLACYLVTECRKNR